MYLSYFRLYLREFGDTARFRFLRGPYIANLTNFQDIEMGPAFKKESFILVRTSPIFVCTLKRRYSDFKISKMRQEGKSVIFKDIEMEPSERRNTNGYKRFSFE